MDYRIKILLAVLPFLIAGYLGFVVVPPILEEVGAKAIAVEEKKNEEESLQVKLNDQAKITKQKKDTEARILELRNAVPKAPDLDLLTIDLEKMCKDSGVDLISVSVLEAAGASKDSDLLPPPSEEVVKAKEKELALKKKAKPVAGIEDDKAKKLLENTPPELAVVQRQIAITGDYNGLQRFVHELETYQRVVKISEISSHIPKKAAEGSVGLPDETEPGEGDELGDPRQLYVSMKIAAYYLP